MKEDAWGPSGFGPLKRLISAGGELWCGMVHKQISTPICGHYHCLRCNRVYPVLWEQSDPLARRRTPLIRASSKAVLRKAA